MLISTPVKTHQNAGRSNQYHWPLRTPPSLRTQFWEPLAGGQMRLVNSQGTWSKWTWGSTLLQTAGVHLTTSCSPWWEKMGRTLARETQVNFELHMVLWFYDNVQEVPLSLKRMTGASHLWEFLLEVVLTAPSLETPATTGRMRQAGGSRSGLWTNGSRTSSFGRQNLVWNVLYL